MALRLELKQVRGTPADIPARRWYFEAGRRTLGRASDCNWHIPDPRRMVSKLHCTIEADRSGFLLRDNSANGSKVDGRTVLDGDIARLSDGSVIEIGDFAFAVKLTGEPAEELADPEAGLVLGDDSLTISSILADVAPKSQRSSGLYGSHEALPEGPGEADMRAKGTASSRNVEIGWRGPPDTSGPKPILPMDWESESDFGNTVEHGLATRVSVPIIRESVKDDAPVEEALPQDGTVVPFAPPEPVSQASSDPDTTALRHLAAAVGRNERACLELFEILGIAGEAPKPALPDPLSVEALQAALEAVLGMQQTLATALNRLLDEMGRKMEPAAIEAQVDALPVKRLWRQEGVYWQAYKSHFEKEGGQASLRDLFREVMQSSIRTEAVRRDLAHEPSDETKGRPDE